MLSELQNKFGKDRFLPEQTADLIPTYHIKPDLTYEVLSYLKTGVDRPFQMLYDLTAIDERNRSSDNINPTHPFTLVYHLISFDRNEDLRIKVDLEEDFPSQTTITGLWPMANWYEREVYDMFGITFTGHPHLRRILMPDSWSGHPLRKEHPARATEMDPFEYTDDYLMEQVDSYKFKPEEWGMKRQGKDGDYMFLNVGPQHPGTHGVLRLVLQLDGEDIVDIVPDIGFHHRGAEKMAERQSWHTFIPYTDRIDYLGGVMNNLPYVLAVEKLGGINVPDRAQVIRVMMCELFRIASHLVWYATFAQDIGQLSPVFYMFSDREKAFDIVSAICGARMHPNWFRIGGVAQDLPQGWQPMFQEFIKYLRKRLTEYDKMVLGNRIFQARTKGIGIYTKQEAIEWGVTGPGLRACGFEWDFRKKRPYSSYDQFDFEIPVAANGDCYDRALIRVEEMRQSLRIIEQCLNNMPEGPYKSDHPKATPPDKKHTMQDIETLITHFLNVSWGPVIPAGEAFVGVEATKGNNGYYLISDGGTAPYRARIRTPSFPHMQMVPYISKGYTVADLLVIIGSVDFVLADIDR
ncbi:MAG: NADH-quinone oxidoreductase subunit C/D [Cyclobacteriaceae bacterium]|nr:MAG: NADH-quinone oxidoreductase subunit C/D [Cyclobacteriaceae bacterium]